MMFYVYDSLQSDTVYSIRLFIGSVTCAVCVCDVMGRRRQAMLSEEEDDV